MLKKLLVVVPMLVALENAALAEPLCAKSLHALSPEKQVELKRTVTKTGVTLDKVLKDGTDNPDSSIGCYAGDVDSYRAFAPMFDGVISEYHQVPPNYKFASDFNLSNLPAFSPDIAKEIISIRIRTARNLANYPFEASMTRKDRLALEKEVLDTITATFKGTEFAGTYYSSTKISPETKDELIKKHWLFKDSDKDPHLQSAGINSDWPIGRGTYVTNDGQCQIWINEEDHLRVMCLEKGSNLKQLGTKLFKLLTLLNTKLKFAQSEKYGYLNSCPTNIGTALRASMHIKIPNTSEEELKKICKPAGLAVRGTGGEHTAVVNDVYDISYKKRLGGSEAQLLTDFVNQVNTVLKR